MDEVIIKGTKYISSKRAAKMTGYAKDYIGQLVRMGKVPAIKVGRAWFVEEQSVSAVSKHIEKEGQIEIPSQQLRAPSTTQIVATTAIVQFPKTWSDIKYFKDDEPLLPSFSDKQEMISLSRNSACSVKIKRVASPDRYLNRELQPSIDGIRVAVRDVVTRNEPYMALGEAVESAGKVESLAIYLTKIFVAALVVSVIALLIPIFG